MSVPHRTSYRLSAPGHALDGILRDVLYALRVLSKSPGVTAVLVLTLAVGIGATTATFGVVDALLLRPLPVRDQGSLVILSAHDGKRPDAEIGIPSTGVRALGKASRSFVGIAPIAQQGAQPFAARYHDRLLSLSAAFVAGDFFRVLGAIPVAGRLLGPEDDGPGAGPAVVLSYDTWQREFAGDTSVVGQEIQLVNGPQRIVGVAPKGLGYPLGADVWAAMGPIERMFPDASGPDAGFPSDVLARLRPGVTLAQAQAEYAAYLREYPSRTLGDPAFRTANAQLFVERVVGSIKPTLIILSAAVALVLLVALTNAAGLLVTRGLARSHELALRAALGAGRGRLVRQLLTENAELAVAAGLLGVVVAAALLRTTAFLAPPELIHFDAVRISVRVLAFAVSLTVGTILLFGLGPALLIAHSRIEGALRVGSRTLAGGRRGERSRRVMVAGQVALAVVVLTAAGLLGRSLERLQQVDLGFAPGPLLFVGLEDMTPFDAHTQSWAMGAARYHAVLDALAAELPREHGIEGVTTVFTRPFSGTSLQLPYEVQGSDASEAVGADRVTMGLGLESHFSTLGIVVRRGRDFTTADRMGAPQVAVVSEGFARRNWPGRDAIGQRVRLNPADSTQPWRTVVGVVANTRYRNVTESPEPTVYIPLRQTKAAPMFLAIRTSGVEPRGALQAFGRVLTDANPAFGIRETSTGAELLDARLARPRFLAATLAALSGAAVILSGVGLYGLLAAAVRERRHEIAVRMALGATPTEARALMMHEAMLIIGIGLATGIVLALVGTRFLSSALYGVTPADPLAFSAAVLAFVAVAGVAAYAPVARAARVDALAALRAE